MTTKSDGLISGNAIFTGSIGGGALNIGNGDASAIFSTAGSIRSLTTAPLTDAGADKVLAAVALPVRKKHNQPHYKAIAKAAEKLAGERLVLLEAESDAVKALRRSLLDAEAATRIAGYDVTFWRRASLVLSVLFSLAVVWR